MSGGVGPHRVERQLLAQGVVLKGKSRAGRVCLEAIHLYITSHDLIVLVEAQRVLHIRLNIVDRARWIVQRPGACHHNRTRRPALRQPQVRGGVRPGGQRVRSCAVDHVQSYAAQASIHISQRWAVRGRKAQQRQTCGWQLAARVGLNVVAAQLGCHAVEL